MTTPLWHPFTQMIYNFLHQLHTDHLYHHFYWLIVLPDNNNNNINSFTKSIGKDISYPTRIPSSMSVGETLSPSPTTNCIWQRHPHIYILSVNIHSDIWILQKSNFTLAICLTFITYLASSVFGLIIFVHLATFERNE